MKTLRLYGLALALALAACGGPVTDDSDSSDLSSAKKHHDGGTPGTDGGSPGTDGGVATDGGTTGTDAGTPGPVANPPPASCDQRHPGVTSTQSLVQITRYQGLIHGRNGDHEIAYGTITDLV